MVIGLNELRLAVEEAPPEFEKPEAGEAAYSPRKDITVVSFLLVG